MRKLSKLFAGLLIIGIMFTGCTNQTTPAEPNTPPVEANEDQELPDSEQTDAGEIEDSDKELKQIEAIFYSMDGDTADMLILDTNLQDNELVLMDEPRVFLTDSEVNTVVKLQIKIVDKTIEVHKVENAKKALTSAKFVGFSDNNFAEFKIADNAFMLQIPSEQKDSLDKVKENELLEITITSNETAGANPVLINFKPSIN